MNKRQLSALLTLRTLGVQYHMKSFDDRLTVQKAVYLAQANTVTLGYHFTWYLRGPYAAALTQDIFNAIDDEHVDAKLESWTLDTETNGKLETVKSLLTCENGGLDRARWVELLASSHFLVSNRQVKDRDPDTIQKKLDEYGKNYTVAQVESAVHELGSAGLLR